MAVPKTDYGLGQPDIEGAVGQGLESLAPPVPPAPDPLSGQPAPDATAGQQIQSATGPNFNFTAQPAQYDQAVAPPSSQDFYVTPDMVRGQGAEGPIISARAPYVPLGVLANRQAELDRRKTQLQQDRAKFDPYANIGDASPQYQPLWGKYARGSVDQYIKDKADALFGGDMRMATDYVRTEGANDFRRFTGGLEDTATANKDLYPRVANTYADVVSGKKELPPDVMKEYGDYLGVQDANGVPLQTTNSQDFLTKHRNVEALDSMANWYGQIAAKTVEHALQTITGAPTITRDKYGKIELTTEEEKKFDLAKDALVDQAVASGHDRKTARSFIDGMLPTSTKVDVKMENPVPDTGSGSGSGSSDKPKVRIAVGVTPTYTQGSQTTPGGVFSGPLTEDAITLSPAEDTGGKFKPLSARTFNKNGKDISIVGMQFKNSDGKWKITGRSLNEKQLAKLEEDTKNMDETEKTAFIEQSNYGTPEEFNASDNGPQTESYFGTKDLDKFVFDAVGKAIAPNGTLEQFKEAMKDASFRRAVMQRLKSE